MLDLLLTEILADDSDGLSGSPSHHWSIILDKLGEFGADMLLAIFIESSVDLSVKLACSYSH